MHTEPDPSTENQQPTRARFIVLGWLASLALVLYLDRICMGQAVKPIKDEMDLTKTQMSFITIAFTIAYGLFEVPSGRWGDRIGSRRVIARIVLWWSAFTALTGATRGFLSLLLVRFLFGAGEAGAFPNTARVITKWFPIPERGRVQGSILAASLIGGAAAPSAAAYIISSWGWRWVFVVFGSIGALWVVAFLSWFRDDPADHPAVNAAELAEIRRFGKAPEAAHHRIPWKQARSNRNIWLLTINIACMSFTSYLFFTWYSTFLQEGRQELNEPAGIMVSFILGGGALGMAGGGWLADRLGTSRRRRVQAIIVDTLAALFLFSSTRLDNTYLAVLMTAFACLFMHAQLTTWWSTAIEISGRHVGSLFGLMNGLGTIGAISSQLFFGVFTDARESQGIRGREAWEPAIVVCAILLAVGAACWIFIDPSRKVEDPDPENA